MMARVASVKMVVLNCRAPLISRSRTLCCELLLTLAFLAISAPCAFGKSHESRAEREGRNAASGVAFRYANKPVVAASLGERLGLCNWQCNVKPSARRSGVEGYFTVVVVHYRLAHGQAHSCALAWLLGREERVEDVIFVLRRDTSPGVFKSNLHARFGVPGFGGYPKSSTVDGHGVERIYRQIHKDLLQLVGVTVHYQGLVTQFFYDFYIASHGFCFDETQRVFDDGPHIAGDPERFARARIVQQHPHNARNPIALSEDDLEALLTLRRWWIELQQILRASTNDTHRSTNFVG